jgi:hypothetical protein
MLGKAGRGLLIPPPVLDKGRFFLQFGFSWFLVCEFELSFFSVGSCAFQHANYAV